MSIASPTSELVLAAEQKYWTGNQIAALRQLGVDAETPGADLAIFFHQAVRTGLDPFSKQIYLMQRRTKNQRSNQWETKSTIQTGIDGYRLIARKAASKAKVEFDYGPTEWCGADGVWRDVWIGPGAPVAARVTIYVGEANRQFPAIAHYSEYVQTKQDGTPNSMWSKMVAGQLSKCAEALALRKAFPLDLSGIYTDDEMQQAESDLADLGETSGAPEPAAADAPTTKVGRAPRRARANKAPEPTNTPEPEAHAPAAEPEDMGEKEPETDAAAAEVEPDPAAPDPADPTEPPEDYSSEPEPEPDEGPAAVLEADAEPEAASTEEEPAAEAAAKKEPFKPCTPGQFRKMVELAGEAYPDGAQLRAFLLQWFTSFRGADKLIVAPPSQQEVSRDEAAALTAHLESLLAGELPGV